MKVLFAIGVAILCIIVLSVVIVSIVYFSRSQPTYQAINTNSNTNTFPECIEMSHEAKQVYRVLKNVNVHVTYNRLFEAYTMILCQMKNCKEGMSRRIETMKSWGANENNEHAKKIVHALVKLTNEKTATFLVLVCDLCEKQIKQIQNDKTLTKETITEVVGLNSQFYRRVFDNFNRSCSSA